MKELEHKTIGAMVWNGLTNFLELSNGLEPECFEDERCGWLFEVLKERALKGEPLDDLLMLEQDLHRKGHDAMTAVDIAEMTSDVSAALDIREYIAALRDSHARRRTERTLLKLLQRIKDPAIPAEETLAKATEAIIGKGGLTEENTTRLRDVLGMLNRRINDNVNGIQQLGFLTGFNRLDEYGGLHTQDLVIVAGWSSHGKTALALNMAVHAARHSGAKVLIVSMEMAALQLGARMLSTEADVPSSVILFREFKEEGLRQMDQAIGRMEPIADSIFIADQSIQGLDAILGSIRLHHVRYGTRLVVVDYLQIVGVSQRRDTTREEALADISRRLKNIAKELDICIILLSQVNRDGITAAVPEPSAAQLRGSGQINEAADLTLLVYRPEMQNRTYPSPFQNTSPKGTAMIKVEKDRNGTYGGPGAFIVGFEGRGVRFTDKPQPTP